MGKSLKTMETLLKMESDCTVRLLNSGMPTPKEYIFAILRFNGNTGLWTVRFVEQNMEPVFQESNKEFSEAKQKLLQEVGYYRSKGYKITAVTSGYYIPPWVRSKKETYFA